MLCVFESPGRRKSCGILALQTDDATHYNRIGTTLYDFSPPSPCSSASFSFLIARLRLSFAAEPLPLLPPSNTPTARTSPISPNAQAALRHTRTGSSCLSSTSINGFTARRVFDLAQYPCRGGADVGVGVGECLDEWGDGGFDFPGGVVEPVGDSFLQRRIAPITQRPGGPFAG